MSAHLANIPVEVVNWFLYSDIIHQVVQRVIQEPERPPTRGVAVGNYDVNQEYFTEAEVLHTIAEHVQRVKEKEIQTWIQRKSLCDTYSVSP